MTENQKDSNTKTKFVKSDTIAETHRWKQWVPHLAKTKKKKNKRKGQKKRTNKIKTNIENQERDNKQKNNWKQRW